MEINSQRVLRTGDEFFSNNKKMVIHYLMNFDNQLSFEEPVYNIKAVLAYNGNDIVEIDPTKIII